MNRNLVIGFFLSGIIMISACAKGPPGQGSLQELLPEQRCHLTSDPEPLLANAPSAHPCRLVWEAFGFRPQALW